MEIRQSTIARDDVFAKEREDVLAEQLGEEFAILDVTGGQYYRLNDTGAMVWRLLHQGNSLARTFETLLEEYDVSEEHLAADLTHLVSDLQQHGLVEFYVKPQA